MPAALRATAQGLEGISLRYKSAKPIVVIEAYAINGWERYADAGISMKSFGKSLPGAVAYSDSSPPSWRPRLRDSSTRSNLKVSRALEVTLVILMVRWVMDLSID